jgi:hypothetical protein
MKNWESLKEVLDNLEYDFTVKLQRAPYSATNMAYYSEDSFHYDIVVLKDDTAKNVIYVYIGYLLCKYGKYIHQHFVECITNAVNEIEENPATLDLTVEEQQEILEIARKVKKDLVKLKVFPNSVSLIELEEKEYLESQQK